MVSNPTLEGLTITRGYSAYYGGAVYSSTFCTIRDCIFRENYAGGTGGALDLLDAGGSVERCIFIDNETYWYDSAGGALSGNGVYVANCVFSGNRANIGGALDTQDWDQVPELVNCTFINNDARSYGGAVHVSGSAWVTNCIAWGNTSEDGVGPEISVWQEIGGGDQLVIESCNIAGGLDDIYRSNGDEVIVWNGQGNTDADPGFALPGDYHLGPASPCIDAGTDTPGGPTGTLTAEDIHGGPRNVDGDGDAMAAPDMGAYEYNPALPTLVVSPTNLAFQAFAGDPDPASEIILISNAGGVTMNWNVTSSESWLSATPASGSTSGEVDAVDVTVDVNSLAPGVHEATLRVSAPGALNAPAVLMVTLTINQVLHVPSMYPTIQQAIDAAGAGDEVVVADGVYTLSTGADAVFDNIDKQLTIRSENGPSACFIEGPGSGSYQSGAQVGCQSGSVVIDGFTFRNWANGACGLRSTGGVIVRDSVFTNNTGITFGSSASADVRPASSVVSDTVFESCTFTDNAAHNGGALTVSYSVNLTLRDCTFTNNLASQSGGAVYADQSRLTLERCSFVANTAGRGNGGAIAGAGDNVAWLVANSCDFIDNWALLGTGGALSIPSVYWSGISDANALTHCRFAENRSEAGGGLATDGGEWVLHGCVFTGNTAEYGGAADLLFCTATVTNSVFCFNEATSGFGNGIYNNADLIIGNSILYDNSGQYELAQLFTPPCCGYSAVNYSCLQGWTGTLEGEGTFDADPLFVDPAGADGMLGTVDDDFRLAVGSPCIDAGDNTVVPADSFDLDGDGNTTEPTPVDLAGAPRFVDVPAVPDTGVGSPPIVDIGAYELAGLGDCTGNGVWEMDDVNVVLGCVEGPDSPMLPACACGDLDGDGDVDIADIAILQELFEAE